MNVNEHGGYNIGTKVGQIKLYMSRNQVQFVANATLDVSEVPVSDMSVRDIVSKISLSGGQGFVHCPNFSTNIIATMFIYIHHNTFYVSLVGRAPINRRNCK
jgi:hypothetical protein